MADTNRRGSAFMLFLLSCFVVFIFLLRGGIHLLSRQGFAVSEFISSPWFLIFQHIIIFMVPLLIWLALHREKFSTHIQTERLGAVNIILIVVLSLVLQPVMMLLSGITGLFFPNQVGELVVGWSQQPFWLMLLAMAVSPAVFEELVFRGYIQSAYRHIPIKKAALINGLFFAIIHISPQQFLYAFVMGIIWAYIVHYTRNIFAGILSHFIINASQVSLARLAEAALGWITEMGEELGIDLGYTVQNIAETEITREMQLQAIAQIGIIALFTAPIIYVLFKLFFSHNRERVQVIENAEPLRLARDPFFIVVIIMFIWLAFFGL